MEQQKEVTNNIKIFNNFHLLSIRPLSNNNRRVVCIGYDYVCPSMSSFRHTLQSVDGSRLDGEGPGL